MSIRDEIRGVGREILTSEAYQSAMAREHHYNSNVADHSYSVAMTSLKVCKVLNKLHVRTDNRAMIRGALCHDLGLARFRHTYQSGKQCCFQHPVDSVDVAKEILPDINEVEVDIISHHMFPLTIHPPKTVEGYVITYADKYCSIKDFVCIVAGKLRRKKVYA
ncbi:MAG: HD domain-containing protein [Lachnospiraceae bacterium]|nr:HD domain-containing protein [Lachnospiraceae bacterium]